MLIPTLDYMMSLKFRSGNYPSSLESGERDKLVHWCHGAPGFIYMFTAAYQVWQKFGYSSSKGVPKNFFFWVKYHCKFNPALKSILISWTGRSPLSYEANIYVVYLITPIYILSNPIRFKNLSHPIDIRNWDSSPFKNWAANSKAISEIIQLYT